ncbi:YbaN family protein [Streptomyces sp. NBC_00335]|uniref:hypothetical protein n=1 Tax=unclassified Streptomyces TaxID=2593676 RepID=UPI002252A21F|nr:MULTISPECIES: hypothetical protein [unclassified Streptomyces]MCX5405877.1 YbaN family protein [Streptomyces sp. NBC_00086]
MTDVTAGAGTEPSGPEQWGPQESGPQEWGPVEALEEHAGPEERIHWLQRSMAGLAALLMAALTAVCATSPLGMVLLLPLVAIASTLFVRERDAFRTLCITVGGLGFLIGILLATFGFLPVLPSAIVLLLAAWADPRRSTVCASVCAAVSVLVAAVALTAAGSLAYNAWLRPSYAYSVDVEGRLYTQDGLHEGELWEYGVTGIYETGLDTGTRLKVTYDESLTGPERAALRAFLEDIPGAGPLQDCGRGDCD